MSITRSLSLSKFRRLEYLYLVYLVFFFIDPFMRGSLRFWLECLGMVAVFLVLYATFMDSQSPRTKLWLVVAIWSLGSFGMPVTAGAVTFVIYAGALLPFALEAAGWVLGGLIFISACLALESWRLHHSLFNTSFYIFWVFVVGVMNIFFSQKHRAECKLRAAQEENLALAAVAERERIARDLHDVLGHTLSVIVLKAELAGRLLSQQNALDPERAALEIADVERIARTALADVREAIGGYRARGLAAEIEAARRTLDAAGVTLTAESTPSSSAALSTAEETVLALALREAVTNIVRHAKASTCRLRFVCEDGHRRLVVEDDGHHPLAREGNGLRGMRERVEALGGSLQVEREGGTRLLIEIPLHAKGALS
jgi:two-component system sensor histidine kinase DesK